MVQSHAREEGKGSCLPDFLQYYLKSPALIILCMDPGSKSQLCDKNLGCLGKQHRGFCTDHLQQDVGPPCQSPASHSKQSVCPLSHVLPMGYGARTSEQEGGRLKRFQGKINPRQSRDKAGSTQKGRGRKVMYLAPSMYFLPLIKAFQRN